MHRTRVRLRPIEIPQFQPRHKHVHPSIIPRTQKGPRDLLQVTRAFFSFFFFYCAFLFTHFLLCTHPAFNHLPPFTPLLITPLPPLVGGNKDERKFALTQAKALLEALGNIVGHFPHHATDIVDKYEVFFFFFFYFRSRLEFL